MLKNKKIMFEAFQQAHTITILPHKDDENLSIKK